MNPIWKEIQVNNILHTSPTIFTKAFFYPSSAFGLHPRKSKFVSQLGKSWLLRWHHEQRRHHNLQLPNTYQATSEQVSGFTLDFEKCSLTGVFISDCWTF